MKLGSDEPCFWRPILAKSSCRLWVSVVFYRCFDVIQNPTTPCWQEAEFPETAYLSNCLLLFAANHHTNGCSTIRNLWTRLVAFSFAPRTILCVCKSIQVEKKPFLRIGVGTEKKVIVQIPNSNSPRRIILGQIF
jgi:hypothetical protein